MTTAAAAAIVLLAACTADETAGSNGNAAMPQELRLAVSGLDGLQVNTRTTDQSLQLTHFDSGATVDIFLDDDVKTGGEGSYTIYPEILTCTNGETENDITPLSMPTGTVCYWPMNGHGLNVYGVYPSGQKVTPAGGEERLLKMSDTNVPFTIKANQSADANYKASDLMVGMPLENNGNPVQAPNPDVTENPAVLVTFKHLLTKININLRKTAATTNVSDEELAKAKVTILGLKPTTTFAPKNFDVGTATGEATPILLYNGSTTANTWVTKTENEQTVNDYLPYSAIVVPQTVTAGTKFIQIDLPNGDQYVYAPTTALTLSAQTAYNFDIQIHKASILLTATITDWKTGDSGTSTTNPGTAVLQPTPVSSTTEP